MGSAGLGGAVMQARLQIRNDKGEWVDGGVGSFNLLDTQANQREQSDLLNKILKQLSLIAIALGGDIVSEYSR